MDLLSEWVISKVHHLICCILLHFFLQSFFLWIPLEILILLWLYFLILCHLACMKIIVNHSKGWDIQLQIQICFKTKIFFTDLIISQRQKKVEGELEICRRVQFCQIPWQLSMRDCDDVNAIAQCRTQLFSNSRYHFLMYSMKILIGKKSNREK